MIKKYILLTSMLGCVSHAYSGGLLGEWNATKNLIENGQKRTTLIIENDSLLLTKRDGFYTSGIRYAQQYEQRNRDQWSTFEWHLAQELYTPSDIKLLPNQIPQGDHPYAGWLHGGIIQANHMNDGRYWKWGIDVGCLGPCAGGAWTQTHLHRLLQQPIPQGWSTQVRNEVGMVGLIEISPVRWHTDKWLDIAPDWQARLGNIYTDMTLGMTIRVGQLNLTPDETTFHSYLRLSDRVVGYNATIQGGYFSKDHPRVVAPKRWVGQLEGGIVYQTNQYFWRGSVIRRGTELRDDIGVGGAQNYAHLEFSYRH